MTADALDAHVAVLEVAVDNDDYTFMHWPSYVHHERRG